jgi:hypothetical protein
MKPILLYNAHISTSAFLTNAIIYKKFEEEFT